MTSDLTVRIPAEQVLQSQKVRDIASTWMRGQVDTRGAERSIVALGFTSEEAQSALAFLKAGTE